MKPIKPKRAQTCFRRSLTVLMVVERTILTLAALLALVPLWWYISESGERRLDRVSNLISAGVSCQVIQTEVRNSSNNKQSMADRKGGATFHLPKVNIHHLETLCAEVVSELSKDRNVKTRIAAAKEYLERISSGHTFSGGEK